MPGNKQSHIFCPTWDEVDLQIQRILTSPDGRITPQQSALLKYVVNQTLAGKADRIKGYTIATEVFGRRSDFDQNIDPIVSIQAARLRRALADYYYGAGNQDPLRIDIPKGSYVPEFERRQSKATAPAAPSRHTGIAVKSRWPAVIVRPLRNLSGDPELDYWGIGLAMELAHELNRYPDIRVMTHQAGNPEPTIDPGAVQFSIDGNVRGDSTKIKISAQLTNTQTRRMVWSESYRFAAATDGLIAFQEDISRSIAVKIAGQHGSVAKTVDSMIAPQKPSDMQVYTAVLRYYEYNLKLTPDTFAAALEALQRAVAIDPECGQAWSMLAHLFADIYALDVPGFEAPLEKAFLFGQNALRLMPDDQRTRIFMAYTHMFRNELAAGLAEAEQALRLGPKTLFMLDGIGYLLTLMGEWERGPALIEDVIRLNPFYAHYVHYATWLNHIRLKSYKEAYQETLKLNRPALFWDHLARAASLGLLGRVDDGGRAVSELLRLKPDFPERGRFLIQCYIKFDEIVDRVIHGLATVGVKVQ